MNIQVPIRKGTGNKQTGLAYETRADQEDALEIQLRRSPQATSEVMLRSGNDTIWWTQQCGTPELVRLGRLVVEVWGPKFDCSG